MPFMTVEVHGRRKVGRMRHSGIAGFTPEAGVGTRFGKRGKEPSGAGGRGRGKRKQSISFYKTTRLGSRRKSDVFNPATTWALTQWHLYALFSNVLLHWAVLPPAHILSSIFRPRRRSRHILSLHTLLLHMIVLPSRFLQTRALCLNVAAQVALIHSMSHEELALVHSMSHEEVALVHSMTHEDNTTAVVVFTLAQSNSAN